MSVTAIVLAGGRSSRFGSPKVAAELDGRPLLDHVLDAVAAVATDVVVVLGPDQPAPAMPAGVRAVRDTQEFGGPLVGLAVGLEASTSLRAVVVGADMPRLRPAVLEALLAALADPGRPAAILEEPAGRRPLPLALAVEPARRAAVATLASGGRSLLALLERLEVAVVPAAQWRALDPDGDSLADVDRPEDLERLRTSDPGPGGLP